MYDLLKTAKKAKEESKRKEAEKRKQEMDRERYKQAKNQRGNNV